MNCQLVGNAKPWSFGPAIATRAILKLRSLLGTARPWNMTISLTDTFSARVFWRMRISPAMLTLFHFFQLPSQTFCGGTQIIDIFIIKYPALLNLKMESL
jgi:hypothetical protein